MVAAANDLLAVLDDDGRKRISFAVDAVEWQTWANPEFLQFDTGLRLDLQPVEVREKALALMRASLSPEGYELAHAMMLINGFLGEVVDLETVLNEFSYNIALYGEPDLRAPWGWQLFGHHCAVNCLVVEGRMVVSPVFLGAEPDEIDAGPHAGLRDVFADRIDLGTAADGRPARRPAPRGRRLRADGRPGHAARAGCTPATNGTSPARSRTTGSSRSRASGSPSMPAEAQRAARRIAETFVGLLPEGPRAARMREIEAHLDETWFSWIGGIAAGRRLLLPPPVAGADRRARPPLRRLPRLRHPAALPHPHRAAHPARQRLRPRVGPAVAGAERRR